MKRNQAMAERLAGLQRDDAAVAILAFDGGNGTDNMINTAGGMGLPVWRTIDGRWERVR